MMSRRKAEISSVRISDEEYSRLESKFEGLRNEVKITKVIKDAASGDIYKSAKAIVEEECLRRLTPNDFNIPDQDLLSRKANRHRQKTRPTEPRGVDFELVEEAIPADFLKYDMTVDGARHLVFATSTQIRLLERAKTWYMDGTFKILRSRDPFEQLFSIHVFLKDEDGNTKQVPLVFVFMSRRRKKDYKTVFKFLICKRKLDSKCEALLILSKELDQCRSERDQFKLMAEQLRERYQSAKKQLSGQFIPSSTDNQTLKYYSEMQSQSLAKLLCDARDLNKSQQFEIDDLKQKLQDACGDIRLLREQIARQRVGTTDEGMNTRHFPAHEREDLVHQLEAAKDQYLQLERDLQQVLDEKEELVTERDVYKTKYERLNQELNYILKGDENRVVDIDALVMENKYLQDRMKQTEEEKSMAMAAASKYKTLLERRKTKGCMKLGQSKGGSVVISHKQVKQVLDGQGAVMATPQAMADLQALAGALLDTVNDKNLALSHQRKTNKILGSRVAELEKKIKTLEVAGLWNVPTNVSASLEKLRAECDEVKTLIPRQTSQSSDTSAPVDMTEVEEDSELGSVSPLDSVGTTPDHTPTHAPLTQRSKFIGSGMLGHLELEDLDLLPTKEVSCRPITSESNKTVLHSKSQLIDKCSHISHEDDFHTESYQSDDYVPTQYDSVSSCSLQNTGTDINSATPDLLGADPSPSSTETCVSAPDSDVDCSESLESHDQGNTTTQTLSDTEIVHVYNMDKTAEEDEGDLEDEDRNKNLFNISPCGPDSNQEEEEEEFEEDGCVDDKTAEKMGLLMGNMAQKMKAISHCGQNGDAKGPINAELMDHGIVSVEGGGSEPIPPSSPSQKSPLLTNTQGVSGDQLVHVEDVEC